MGKNEFIDRLFDVLNDTDNLPIQDLKFDGIDNNIYVYLEDGTKFLVCVEWMVMVIGISGNKVSGMPYFFFLWWEAEE